MITLKLPYPISANRYWTSMADPKLITELYRALQAASRGNVAPARALVAQHGNKIPHGRAMTFPTGEAKAYKEHVGWIARAAGLRQPLAGPIDVEYRLYPHLPKDWAKRAKEDPVWWDLTVQCIDLDNARKVVNDALNGIAWTDDKMIRYDPGRIMVPDGASRLELTIKPYEREHPQVGLFAREPVYVPKPAKEVTTTREKKRVTAAPLLAQLKPEEEPF